MTACIELYFNQQCIDEMEENGLDEASVAKSIARKYCYRIFVTMRHGYLGQGNRVRIPTCVQNGIRRRFPDIDGTYMGYLSD